MLISFTAAAFLFRGNKRNQEVARSCRYPYRGFLYYSWQLTLAINYLLNLLIEGVYLQNKANSNKANSNQIIFL